MFWYSRYFKKGLMFGFLDIVINCVEFSCWNDVDGIIDVLFGVILVIGDDVLCFV